MSETNRAKDRDLQALLDRQWQERLEIQRILAKDGIFVQIGEPLDEEYIREFHEWKPIKIEGVSLSETIIKDRR
ncbi:MAG: hypothetical protein O3A46_05075 [Candidatus Poribacteria bacterium]|nr:hypothetical protein [Candidatus Poribacteria bacterium]